MKKYLLLGFFLLGCGQSARRIDPDPDPSLDDFYLSLPADVGPIEERYMCRHGIRIDPTFTPDQVAIIHQSMEIWNYYSGNPDLVKENPNASKCHMDNSYLEFPDLGLTVTDGKIIIADHTWEYCQTRYELPENKLGCYRAVVLHELAHSLGLGHLSDDDIGIMTPNEGSLNLTESDLNLCKAVRVCPESMQINTSFNYQIVYAE